MNLAGKSVIFLVFMNSFPFVSLAGQNYFNNPESVVYDSENQRYLVSNKGDGKIISVDKQGNQNVFNSDQASIRGLHIVGDLVYAACNAGLAAFHLNNGKRAFVVPITDRQFLNDVTSDAHGNIYVTDSGGSKVYKINPEHICSTLVPTIPGPNGIMYDSQENRLFVTTGGQTPGISSIRLTDGSLTQIVKTAQNRLDGLTEDTEGNIYYSSWETGSIYKYSRAFTGYPELISSGYNGPADIGCNLEDNILAIPVFNSNTVRFLQLESNSVKPSHIP